jgi:hypothetical protein
MWAATRLGGGIVQIAQESPTVLGQNQLPPQPHSTPEAAQLPISGPEQPLTTLPSTGGGTLSQTLAQPNSINGVPMWAIIVISLLGAFIVFGIVGTILHRLASKNRRDRARRWLMQKEMP